MLKEAHDFRKTVKDPEHRESLEGEYADVKSATHIADNLLIPVAIAYAQSLNARDLNANLVRNKANPSFRDGTALMLNDPEAVADLLLKNSAEFHMKASAFQAKLDQFGRAIYEGKWDEVKANILSAQQIRTPLAGPRKGADTRESFRLEAPAAP